MNNMYETLTRYNSQTGKVQPLLATSWKKSADAKTWTFTIRQGVKFHDGKAMTADDVKASIDRTIKLNQGAAYIWGAVKSIDAPNPTRSSSTSSTRRRSTSSPRPATPPSSTTPRPPGSTPLGKWFARGPRRRHRPVHGRPVEQGPGDRAAPEELPGLLGRLVGRPLQERRVPRRARRPAPRPSSCARARSRWAEQMTPQLWDSLKSDPNLTTTHRQLVPEPARDAEHVLRAAEGHPRAPGAGLRDRLQRAWSRR